MSSTKKPTRLTLLPHGKEACDAVQIDWLELIANRYKARVKSMTGKQGAHTTSSHQNKS